MTEYGLAASTLREITMLKELRHPNIVGLRDVIMSPVGPPPLRQGTAGSGTGRKQSCYLVVELLHCDLHAFMQHRPHALSMSTAKVRVREKGILLVYLHIYFLSSGRTARTGNA